MISSRSIGVVLIFSLCACSETPEAESVTNESQTVSDLRQDPRIAGLVYECAKQEYFGEDASFLIPVLVDKLVRGQRDPLRGARRDLAEAGAAALPELTRLVDAELARGASENVLINVLGTIALMEPPLGRAIVLRLMAHPSENVRTAAMRTLKGRVEPEDYERAGEFLQGTSYPLRAACVVVLYQADPQRLVGELAGWIERSEQEDLWAHASQLLETHPGDLEGIEELIVQLEASAARGVGEVRADLIARRARLGDEAAIEVLRELRDAEVSGHQYFGVEGLASAGLAGELREVLRSSGDARLRALAADAIAHQEDAPEWRAALTLGLSDEDESVRKTCLARLISLSDESAIDFAFSLLESSVTDRQVALEALLPRLQTDAELADEAFEVLKALVLAESLGPISRRASFYQSIGQIPSAAAAEFLLEAAERETEEVDGMRSTRWLLLQAGNTGSPGSTVLHESWRNAIDPVPRLDRLEALYSSDHERARLIFAEAATRDHVTPYEVLFAADKLCRIGPAKFCAPILKRVALRCKHAEVRQALQCLLWRFYGR